MTAKEITIRIYEVYGTDSGVLFGIPFAYRDEVEMVIKVALEIERRGDETRTG
jgi:hypothetical protein